MKKTIEIENKYNVTRQTLHNWMRSGLITIPKKDWRGWFVWSKDNEMEIEKLMTEKEKVKNVDRLEKVNEVLKITNRRYLGSKRKMLGFIEKVVEENTTGVNVVADIFAGTGSVADLFRMKGKKVIVNDILKSNYLPYLTWFSDENVDYEKIKQYIDQLNSIVATKENYVSEHFGDKYFTMDNARKIGEIRQQINRYNDINDRERAFLITSLIYAMDKVANTVGHYDAYRKKMDSFDPIYLKVPELNRNKRNKIYNTDANELVKKIKADLVYIDTPYNSRQYGDIYHLLENIVEWKKPEVSGVARKMIDRSQIKSDYSTNKAPIAFYDLIKNIKAKYILVSYNNMASKGNGRSNAKISNEEIIDVLKSRGKVTVFETPYQFFTTGKTDIKDHKELLYLCEVTPNKEIGKNEYTQSAINYTGGKFKQLEQLNSYFPQDYNNFIDMFSGGANVGINANPNNKIYINDIESNVINFYRTLRDTTYEAILGKIENIISEYGLSDTKTNGYDYYGLTSSDGLAKFNKEKFLKLRYDYNHGKFGERELKSIVFYVLIVFGFNNQIRFNQRGEYNLPVGKRDFNKRMERKLYEFQRKLKEKEVIFSSRDFRDFTVPNKEDFVYLDPPYLISTASYNENNGWKESDEIDLYEYLDRLTSEGVRWAMSNVTRHNGKENRLLLEWSNKYHTHLIDYNYNNSNYQSNAKNNITREVLITNY